MERKRESGLRPYLSSFSVWALSLGTTIGWGSLVVTSKSYLGQGGPAGSVIGMLIGMAIMLIMSWNYQYMISAYPSAGGIYTYTKEIFSYDHAFLASWFLALTYLAVFWANATSVPLFARYFLGSMFRFGKLYTIFGYEVYLGEVLLCLAAIVIAAFFCMKCKTLSAAVLTGMAVLLSAGIIICFAAAFLKTGTANYHPAYLPDKSSLSQVVRIACISPWAYIGFENISHATEEFAFPRGKAFRIMAAAVISGTVLYIFIILLSVSAYPPEYDSWLSYIRDLDNISGLKGLPAFYAADYYLGSRGVFLLALSLLGLILTSLIGNLFALTRLFYTVAEDGVLPARIRDLDDHGSPVSAYIFTALISLVIPFLGRTAIGWIVDVTTLGATMIYGFISACALKLAWECDDEKEKITGLVGLVTMLALCIYLLVPNFFSAGTMADESYILFTVWAVMGFLFFRHILRKDEKRRFGKSIIVWIGLLGLIPFTSLVWMNQTTLSSSSRTMQEVRAYYQGGEKEYSEEEEAFMDRELGRLQQSNLQSMGIVVGLFAISAAILLNNYALMRRRSEETELELHAVRNLANTDALTGVKSKLAYAQAELQLDEQIAAGQVGSLSVAVCDVNGLKQVNDTLGHKAGDAYICAASRLICDIFEHSPVYRTGGDEFVVFITGRDYEAREQLLGRLLCQSRENRKNGEVVVAAGLSDYVPGSDETVHAVFERADARMYENKKKLKQML